MEREFKLCDMSRTLPIRYPFFSFCCLVLLGGFLCTPLSARDTPEDSLRRLLVQTRDPSERVEICVNLDNYCHYVSRHGHPQTAYLLLDESIKAGSNYGMVQALRGLVMSVDKRERLMTHDSVARYLDLARTHLTGDWRSCFLAEIHMRHVRCLVDWSGDEERLIAEITKMYSAPVTVETDVYAQIEHEYALGKLSSLMLSNWEESIQQCLRYYDNVLVLLKRLPAVYRANLLQCMTDNLYVAYFNADEKEKAVEMLELVYRTFDEYKQLDFIRREKFQPYDDIYVYYYEGMARSPEVVGPQRAAECLKEADRINRKPDGFIESLYGTYKEYYMSTGEYRKAIVYLDSLMDFMRGTGYTETTAVLSDYYQEKALCYAALREYRDAYDCFLSYDTMREAGENDRLRIIRQEMDTRYDLNRLELDKLRLEARNRRIGLLALLAVLALAVTWGISQRLIVKKLQRMQRRLIASNQEVLRQSEKAQESERMKTAFINSMCHEVRTPLNSINGFSSLLLDDSIDAETKQEFFALIQQNTDQLTRLLNDLLEISTLDSSNDPLQMETVEVNPVLAHEMDQLIAYQKKPDIEYRLVLDEVDLVMRTHAAYLGRVVANLLSNANKFTEAGSITLFCGKTPDGKGVLLSVTDTGIGIADAKREWVFERFTKVDEFKPGIGMGLYVCRLIVQRLHGTIRIDPKYRDGTRVVVTLPLQ